VSEPVYDFDLGNRAYALMTLDEKRQVLEIMARLRFEHVTDRFFEAVSRVAEQARKGASQ